MEMVNNIYGEVHVHTGNSDKIVGKTSPEMALIKRSVKKRDKCCQVCGEEDKPLEIHHIFPQSKYPSVSWNTANLITLCQQCHRKYHEKYEGSEGPVSFAKYIRDGGSYHESGK